MRNVFKSNKQLSEIAWCAFLKLRLNAHKIKKDSVKNTEEARESAFRVTKFLREPKISMYGDQRREQ